MSQNDFVIDNASFPATRADLTAAFQALASNNSGSSNPTTTYANMFYYDTSDNMLKIVSEANDSFIKIGLVDQGQNSWRVLNNTKVVNEDGSSVGTLRNHATVVWQDGLDTEDTLVSPAKVRAAIAALVPASSSSLGVGQAWSVASRAANVNYQNQTGRAIQVSATLRVISETVSGGGVDTNYHGSATFQVSSDSVNFVTLGTVISASSSTTALAFQPIIPKNYVYRWLASNGGSPSSTLAFADFAILQA